MVNVHLEKTILDFVLLFETHTCPTLTVLVVCAAELYCQPSQSVTIHAEVDVD